MTITARYEHGVFKPLDEVTLNEGTIVEVQIPSSAVRLKVKSRSVRDFAFYGMWKDRTDISYNVEYIIGFDVIFGAEREPARKDWIAASTPYLVDSDVLSRGKAPASQYLDACRRDGRSPSDLRTRTSGWRAG